MTIHHGSDKRWAKDQVRRVAFTQHILGSGTIFARWVRYGVCDQWNCTQANVSILKLVLTGVCVWFVWPQTKKRNKRRVRIVSLAGQSGSDEAPVSPRWHLWKATLAILLPQTPPGCQPSFWRGIVTGMKRFSVEFVLPFSFLLPVFNMWKNKLEVNQPCGSALLTQCCFQEFIIRAGPNDRAGFILQPVNGI